MTLDRVLFEKDYLIIYHDADNKLIHLKWKGFANSEQLREAMNAALEFVKDHEIENWLGNLKLMEAILPVDEEWTIREFLPKFSITNLKKMAIVTSMDYLNNSAVKRIVNASTAETKFETRFFVDVNDARKWLTSDI